jgi:Amt family ammonium transporter
MGRFVLILISLSFAGATSVFAESLNGVDSGDTAWILTSTAMVLLMTPGLALFYGGMVRSKNVLGTIMHSIFAMALVGVHWVVIGYSLSFSAGTSFIGGFDYFLLNGVGLEALGTIPHLAFMAFQGMFAIITPALITGAFAERMKFRAYVLFVLAWTTLVYAPVCHWVWASDGWLFKLGALDFAGGTVVHMTSGFSALVAAVYIGKRVGYPKDMMLPNSLIWTVLGAGMLWFGWFGFNGGSALGSGALATLAFVTTQIAAAAGALGWAVAERIRTGKVTVLGVASGMVAGLVGITPASGFVGPSAALAIGSIAGAVCYLAVCAKSRFGYDDALDVFGVHGVGGTLGALLTGVFASTLWNPNGKDGLLSGNVDQFVVQLISVAVTAAYAIAVTWVILKVLDMSSGIRVSESEEREGLDLTQHGETAYHL